MTRGEHPGLDGGPAPRQPMAVRRRSRVPVWRRALAAAATLALIAGLVLGVRWLLTAPTFAVAEVRTGPYRYCDREVLEATLRTALDRNIWRADTDGLAAAVTALPWVREARVSRRLPATLKVRIVEWRPLLLIEAGDGGPRLLAEDGSVLPVSAGVATPDLPVVVDDRGGAARGSLTSVTSGLLLAAVRAIGETGLETVSPVDFVVLEDTGVSLILQENKGRLLLGREAYGRRLRRYLAVRDRVAGQVVDLRFDGQVCVRDSRV